MSAAGPRGGFGVVGIGDPGSRSKARKRPDLCGAFGHPGVTYNPWSDRTWCLCGRWNSAGNHHTHAACCGGPLEEVVA